MKIVLPKTLLEPGTIPWPFIIGGSGLAMDIIEAIHNFFRAAERKNEVPTDDWDAWGVTQYSIAEMVDLLEFIAMDAGAKTAKAIEHGCDYGDKFAGKKIGRQVWSITGFAFQVAFTIKNKQNDLSTYRTRIHFWFDPKRRTLFK